jgi:hypothetical protein
LTQRLQPGNDREQAHILTYDKKNCIYVGAIQQQPAFFPRQKLPNFDADGKRPIVYIDISSNVQNSG